LLPDGGTQTNESNSHVWTLHSDNSLPCGQQPVPTARGTGSASLVQHRAQPTDHGWPDRRDFESARAGFLALGLDSVLVERCKRNDQCPCRDSCLETDLPFAVSPPSLPDPCRWLLRMAEDRQQQEAAVLLPLAGGPTVRVCRVVGSLASS